MSDTATMEPQVTGGDSGAEQADAQDVDTSLTSQSQSEPQAKAQGNAEQKSVETPKWIYQLPGELQSQEQLSKFSTIGDLAKSFLEREANAERTLLLPGEDASDEDRQAFYNRLGRPETPEGYEFEGLEERDEIGFTEEQEADYRAKAHELGLTVQQAKDLHAWQAARTKQALEDHRQAQEKAVQQKTEALRKEWGDSFAENVAKAKQAFSRLGGEDLTQFMKDAGAEREPALIKTFAEIYNVIGDDTFVNGAKDEYGNTQTDWYPTMEE